MDKINLPKGIKIFLNFETQTSLLGRDFRLSGISKDTTKAPIFTNGAFKFHWFYIFRYLDDDSFFQVEIDFNDKFVSLTKV